MVDSILNFLESTGIYKLFYEEQADGSMVFNDLWWQSMIMLALSCVLIYLAIGKQFEPLLLLPIAVGMLLTNLPGAGMFHLDFFIAEDVKYAQVLHDGGLLDLLYLGVKLGIYPCLIFIGIGAMTDFSPLISNPKSLLIGAGAQLGVFAAFSFALMTGQFTGNEAAAIGIIGGADGPTAILVTKTLAPPLLGAIAIAAYSYMALIPIIQPPFMRFFTTEAERKIRMTELRKVSRLEKLVFPIMVTTVVGLILPEALTLVGCLMFGNLLNVCGVTERLSKTVQNELMNIVTVFLGISVGATASAENFLRLETLLIIGLGLAAFCVSTCGGLITAKIMCKLTGGKINPLIGSAGVSAVPMAARVAQKEGQKADPGNFLLMHAMGPNVAGVIGSAVAAGVLLSYFG
ncbi:MAG: sodium ion-translocating decarboxylase subunit beta [Ruminococcaceae bacterium]|nr:sodium ion-translocating decarboxylase subunit beta [Oscillospiraceae bacterium]